MRVLAVLGSARGGMRTYVVRSLAALIRAGDEGALIGPDPIDLPGVPSFPLPIGQGALTSGRLARLVRGKARDWGADLLHAHGVRAAEVVRRTGLPFVYTLHGFPPPGLKGVLFDLAEGRIVRGATAVSAVSAALARRAEDLGATHVRLLSPLPPVPTEPPPMPPATEGIVLGCLARLAREKGIDVLLEAFRSVGETWPRARLLIGGDGPERSSLVGLANQLGVGERVAFVGWVDDVPAFLGRIHLYVQPSLREGLGLAAREALALGRPVVASRTGGLPESVGEGPWALLVQPGDPSELARAVADVLARGPQGLGRQAHAWAVKAFLPETFDDPLRDFYRAALDRASR